jgi:hypothetical protein
MTDFLLCSECFQDQGLKLDAQTFGNDDASTCPNCGATSGKKLTQKAVGALAHRFFTWGTLLRLAEYEKSKIIENLALFGRPVEKGDVKVKCIDKIIINRVDYGFHFGPVYQRL